MRHNPNNMDNTFLSSLEWRQAEKHFDPAKKVSQEDLNKILHAIKLAPSSFGLQPYHVYVVSNADVKMQLKEKGYNQAQFADASHVLVFCSRGDLGNRINAYFEMMSGGDAEKRKGMEGYENMMKGFAEGHNAESEQSWAARQAYLALGFGLAACAELQIDACPMEGFSPQDFDAILKLPAGLHSLASMAIGYRVAGEDSSPKVRFPDEDLFTAV